MFNEQRIRSVLFYLSISIFFCGLPFILSFALGYKFDPHTFKFTRMGLIVIKTQPSGADVYLDGKLQNEGTPLTINELLPGKYPLTIELDNYYPWVDKVNVDAGKVTRIERIILFPIRPNIKQITKSSVSFFWADEDEKVIYYVDQEEGLIYKTDLNGERREPVAGLRRIDPPAKAWRISPDKAKLLYYNSHQIAVVPIKAQKGNALVERPFVMEHPSPRIVDIFWYSDSYHIILASDVAVEVLEARPAAIPVKLADLNNNSSPFYYSASDDSLYFIDSQRASDGRYYDNLYKLDLSIKNFLFKDLIKLAPGFEKPGQITDEQQ